jgi:hypothetical protein
MSKSKQYSIRLPPSVGVRLTRVSDEAMRDPMVSAALNGESSMAMILRAVVELGLPLIEARYGLGSLPAPVSNDPDPVERIELASEPTPEAALEATLEPGPSAALSSKPAPEPVQEPGACAPKAEASKTRWSEFG